MNEKVSLVAFGSAVGHQPRPRSEILLATRELHQANKRRPLRVGEARHWPTPAAEPGCTTREVILLGSWGDADYGDFCTMGVTIVGILCRQTHNGPVVCRVGRWVVNVGLRRGSE